MKKKIQKLTLIFFIFLVLITSGCKGKNSGDGRPITDADVRKGLDGLTMEFTKNTPPANVLEDGIFPIGINLRNKGAFDIINGLLVLGFESQYVNTINEEDEKKTLNIEGKSIFNINGDEKFITLNAKAKKIGAQSETHPSTIMATACYPYKTILGTSVCVDTDVYGLRKTKKACTVKDLQFEKGQGAPVTITRIETRILPDEDNKGTRPHFIIHVENKGGGEVVTSDKIAKACSNEPLSYDNFNRITIKASLSGKELNCNIEGSIDTTAKNYPIRLRAKKDMVRCVVKDEDTISNNLDAYTAPLNIELDYGYTFTISKDIIIEKILKY